MVLYDIVNVQRDKRCWWNVGCEWGTCQEGIFIETKICCSNSHIWLPSTICSHVRHLNNHNSNLMSMQQSPSISHKTQHIIRCHQKSNDIKAETSDNQNQKHTRTTQRFFIWTETGISIKLNGFIRTKTCQTKCKQYLDMTNKRDEKKTNQLFDFGFFFPLPSLIILKNVLVYKVYVVQFWVVTATAIV